MKNSKIVLTLKPLFFLFLAFMLVFSGCKQEGCTDPNSLNYDPDAKEDDGSCEYGDPAVEFHFHADVDGTPFAFNQEFQTTDGRTYKFTIARFYASNFSFEDDNGNWVMIDDSYIQVNPETHAYSIGSLPAGHYHGFKFNIGVDSVANHSDPSSYDDTHALSASSPTHAHWTWNSGYQFIKIEGDVDTTMAMNGTPDFHFEMHIGGDQLLREVSFTKMFEAVEGQEVSLEVNVDWAKFFENIDLRTENITHTMDNMPLAMTMANNAPGALSVD